MEYNIRVERGDYLRPLRNHADWEWAIKEVEKYFDNSPVPGSNADARFDRIVQLIEDYEISIGL